MHDSAPDLELSYLPGGMDELLQEVLLQVQALRVDEINALGKPFLAVLIKLRISAAKFITRVDCALHITPPLFLLCVQDPLSIRDSEAFLICPGDELGFVAFSNGSVFLYPDVDRLNPTADVYIGILVCFQHLLPPQR